MRSKAKPSQYAIYMATIDYMIASYGPYSASATGGNGLARDFLAGIAAMYATPSEYQQSSQPYNDVLTFRSQCSRTLARPTRSRMLRRYWPALQSSSRSRYTSFTGKDRRFARGPSLLRRSPATTSQRAVDRQSKDGRNCADVRWGLYTSIFYCDLKAVKILRFLYARCALNYIVVPGGVSLILGQAKYNCQYRKRAFREEEYT